ncbi:MAG: hypothetical protein HOV76_32440 [Hamadaea sp.]|nr:hypothetical protein [Hamadaea sp.]
MATIVPGALWRPIDVGNRAARRKGRGLIGHIAVVNTALLTPGPLATRPSDWHFYLPKNPYPTGERFAQFIDLDLQCWSSAAGNATCPAFESEGGVGADVNGPWTDNQIEAAAMILAYLHRSEGVPLQDMGNSLPTSRGFGVHRYGIDPYRVAGGEKWSSVYAKACPGDARVRQIPQIVARAQQLVNGAAPTPTSEDEDMKVIQNTSRGIAVVGPGYVQGLAPSQLAGATKVWGAAIVLSDADFDAVVGAARDGEKASGVYKAVVAGDGAGPGNNFSWLYDQLNPKLEAVQEAVSGTAPAAGPAVLTDADVDRLTDALAAKLGSRLSNG